MREPLTSVREPLVAVDEDDSRQAQQVQQVHTDGQTCHVEDEHKPTVRVRLVGVVFPLEDEPEHDSRES